MNYLKFWRFNQLTNAWECIGEYPTSAWQLMMVANPYQTLMMGEEMPSGSFTIGSVN